MCSFNGVRLNFYRKMPTLMDAFTAFYKPLHAALTLAVKVNASNFLHRKHRGMGVSTREGEGEGWECTHHSQGVNNQHSYYSEHQATCSMTGLDNIS